MNSFHILKYLNKAKIFVFLFTLLGVFLVYNYATSNQSYSSSAIIQYKMMDETTGQLSNGMTVDTTEIYSSTVVQNVIDDLGIFNSMESIRSSTSVTEVIPSDETARKKALLEKGEAYVYYPSKFLITFRASGMNRASYVRDVLDSILQNYFGYYSEKYVEVAAMPNSATDVIKDQYDYIESVELVSQCVSDMIDFLNVKVEYDSSFRSSTTGYTFEDLLGQYKLISDNTIPSLYATVLESRLSKDTSLLLIKYQNRIDSCQAEIDNYQEQMTSLKELIDSYSSHSKDSASYAYSSDAADTILGSVNGNSNSQVQDTTYDTILTQYVDLDVLLRQKQTELAYNQEILSIFNGTSDQFALSTGDEEITEKNLLAKIQDTVDQISQIYEIFQATLKEYNAYKGASNISTLTSITVSQALNVNLYVVLAVVLFVFVGCAMSIVIGRTSEYMDYMLYVDKKTNLPNRIRCDNMIEHYSHLVLPDNMVMGVLNLDSLNDVNRLKGRNEGDAHLAAFSAILCLLSASYGFIAYNGGSQFFCLFENCGEDKMSLFRSVLQDKVDAYNTENGVSPMSFSLGMANSTIDNCHAMRKMILVARQKQMDSQQQQREAAKAAAAPAKEPEHKEPLPADKPEPAPEEKAKAVETKAEEAPAVEAPIVEAPAMEAPVEKAEDAAKASAIKQAPKKQPAKPSKKHPAPKNNKKKKRNK